VSEQYTADNLLDRHTPRARMERQYARETAREQALLGRRLGMAGGDVLSVGCGWDPGRGLFPAPAWRLTATDIEPDRIQHAREQGLADEAFVGAAGKLDQLADGSYDVVLYRYVLHHIVYGAALAPILAEARRLLRPGGALVAIEPGLFHPIGAGLALANQLGMGVRVHGTPDDIPLSPRVVARDARRAGLVPEVHAVSYSWRRLPAPLQAAVAGLDRAGSARGARWFGHTFLLLARRP
jgi:SAM-dependent methyltransferase